ncbi:hypothetical protein [Polaribacter porphyrae]|uniref:Lipoprotein n=1 Tax=Polaribacter porphyrae TaxID=1137780 RepID=A0A2S7WRH0_9FLAO|nr:hypothetical protein [Polaribacter porphyrae]PQJ80056.1 hypothetical protein BTO18_13125 [Polaribacter porphyrae]
MKTRTVKFLTLVVLVITISLSSCSNNNEDIDEGLELSEVVMQDFVKDIQKLSVPSGLSSSNNQYAQEANLQFQSLKTLGSSFAALFTVPANAVSSRSNIKVSAKSNFLNTKTYTWSANRVSVTYIISETSYRYTFEYSIVSSNFTGKYIDGYQLKDGSYAEMNLFDGGQIISTIKWWVKSNSVKIEMSTDGYRLVMESNTDNSGTMKVYEGTFLAALYEWTASGSGSYTDYNTNQTYTW